MSKLKIVGFVCKFCALLSGEFGPAVKTQAVIETIDIPCAGKMEARLILEAFEKGADGVFVAGCPAHECMNINGSSRARQRVEQLQDLLHRIGVGQDRLVMFTISGTNGPRFPQIAREMDDIVNNIGPSPLKNCVPGKEDVNA